MSQNHKGLDPEQQVNGADRALIALAAVSVGVVCVTGYEAYVHDEADYRQQQQLGHSAAVAVKADGMTLEGYGNYQSPNFTNGTGEIDLKIDPHCALDNVTVEYVAKGDRVTDITNYSFTTYVNARAEEQERVVNKGLVSDTVIEGQQVTFTFHDKQDLMTNILGDEPCKTLAGKVNLLNEVEVR